jgi:hypothetical protein
LGRKEQRVPCGEGCVGIVVLEGFSGIWAAFADRPRRPSRHHTAGCVGRAVVAAGVRGGGRAALDAFEFEGEGQGELLARPARTVPAHHHRGLAAADEGAGRGEGVVALEDFLNHGRIQLGDAAGVAGEVGGEDEGS